MVDDHRLEPGTRRVFSALWRFVIFWLGGFVLCWTVLRIILFAAFGPSGQPAGEIIRAFLVGLQRDTFAAAWYTLPVLVWVMIVPRKKWGRRWHRWILTAAAVGFMFYFFFVLFASYYFFEEFKSSFNTVAVDYLLYPYEVAVNIWESYHVGVVVAVCGALTAGWFFLGRKPLKGLWQAPPPNKLVVAGLTACACVILAAVTGFQLRAPHVSSNRTLNEMANNEAVSFVAAFWTHNLDYTAFYRHLPLDEAYERTRRMLTDTNAVFTEPGRSIHRRIAGDPGRPRLNVVVILEESLGSEFWGCLGHKDSRTPKMDKLATNEGLLFTHLYACGNRTVRGMEGVLSSFPPLPGDAIVRRPFSGNVETLARVLKRDGYTNVFLYGGRGVFDSMKSYAMRNGYDRFVEQKDFKHPTFSTAWGVCDEDLFDRGIQECREMAATGKPFFATFLSTSNHKPYTFPAGRIKENPNGKRRSYAVKYADYALGKFFEDARKESFWSNTVFVVIADHGARLYGQQTIPIHSYEIPLVLLGPAVVKSPARIDRLGSSLDVSPTILGLIGRPYDSLFFGRDLLRDDPRTDLALLNHNRDIGMLKDERLVVLGLMENLEFYSGNPAREEMAPFKSPDEADLELAKDCMAIYEVADDLYMHKRYALDQPGVSPVKGLAAAAPR